MAKLLRVGEGPVLSASLLEPCLVGDGFVQAHRPNASYVVHFRYRLAAFCRGWPPDRTYKIGHAVSDDGINWVKEEAKQIIADRLGPDESQALPYRD